MTTPQPDDQTNHTLTAIAGIRVGLHTDADHATGCAVIVVDHPNVAAAEVRGAAPGTREYALLQPGMTVQSINAIVLSGGSAFGLATADGVAAAMRADQVGYETAFGRVPIVPAAVLFDLSVGSPDAAPSAADGAAAYRAATDEPVPSGAVGPGTGASVAKWRGAPQPGGLGNAVATVGGHTVAAMVAVNASGDLFGLDGAALTGGPSRPDAPATRAYGENTTLVVVATPTPLNRVELDRMIVRAHDALGTCIRPAHTRYDGDICFALSVGFPDDLAPNEPSNADALDAVGEAAFAAVGDAVADAVASNGAAPPDSPA